MISKITFRLLFQSTNYVHRFKRYGNNRWPCFYQQSVNFRANIYSSFSQCTKSNVKKIESNILQRNNVSTQMFQYSTSTVSSPKIIYQTKWNNKIITVRLADHFDYDDILSISRKVTPKADYIPSQFHWFLDTGKVTVLMLFVDEIAVGYVMSYKIDDETVVPFGARMLPKYQGNQLFPILVECYETYTQENNPKYVNNIQVGSMTSGRKNYITKCKSKIIHTWYYVNCTLDIGKIKSLDVRESISAISMEEVKEIFQNKSNLAIFQSEMISLGSAMIPVIVSRDNLVKAAQQNLIFVTRKQNNSDVIDSISFVSQFLDVSTNQQVFSVIYYGSVENFDSHLLKVFHALSQEGYCNNQTETQLFLHYPTSLVESEVVDLLSTVILSSSDTIESHTVNIALVKVNR